MLTQQLNLTAAIVRTYNFTGIGDFVRKLLGFGIRHVVVVVPHDQDNGVTAPILASFDPTQVHLVEQSFVKGGRAWSAMLNAGLDYIETSLGDDFIDFVLMVSNTVLLEAHHLERLYVEMDFGEIMVAGAKFKGVGKQGEEVPLGVAYNHHYRNTFALYRAQAFQMNPALRRFDESFDGAGGMEDLAWKLTLESMTSRHHVAEVPVVVPLLVHAHRTPEQQAEYEATMERGIKAAECHVAWYFRE